MRGVLGIDGSTTCTGFALGAPDKDRPIGGGSWDFPGADPLVMFNTFTRAYRCVNELCRTTRPEWVVIEGNITPNENSNMHTIMVLGQLVAVIGIAAINAGCKVEIFRSDSIRKFFVGKGRFVSKDSAGRKVREDPKGYVQRRCDALGWSYKDGDHADALAACAFGLNKYYGWLPESRALNLEPAI